MVWRVSGSWEEARVQFDAGIRRIIGTTHAVGRVHVRIRRAVRTCGRLSCENAARSASASRSCPQPRGHRPRTLDHGWKRALQVRHTFAGRFADAALSSAAVPAVTGTGPAGPEAHTGPCASGQVSVHVQTVPPVAPQSEKTPAHIGSVPLYGIALTDVCWPPSVVQAGGGPRPVAGPPSLSVSHFVLAKCHD